MASNELTKTPFRTRTHLRRDAELRRQVEQHRGNVLDHLHHQVFAAGKGQVSFGTCSFTNVWFGNEAVRTGGPGPTCGADGSLGGLMPVRC